MNNEDLERIIKNAIKQAGNIESEVTLSSWLATYKKLVAQRGLKSSTVKNRAAIIKHIETALGSKSITSIKPFEISNLLTKFSAHSAGRVLGELRAIYFEAVANGIAETNPALHVKQPKQLRVRKRMTLESWNQMLEKSFDYSMHWVSCMLLLALATGQRRGDLAKMRFDDVVDGCLRIEQQKKAGKPVGARLAIPLNIKLNATSLTLGEILEYCKKGTSGPTILRKSNGGSLEVSSLSARFHELIVAVLGSDAYQQYEWPSLHEVRSLSARTYLAEGMPPNIVQSLLGHKSEEMTKVYLNDRGLTEAEWKLVDISYN